MTKNNCNKKNNFMIFTFIIEFITNLITNGPADYTLTENEIQKNIKLSKIETFKKIVQELFIYVILLIIAYVWIKHSIN